MTEETYKCYESSIFFFVEATRVEVVRVRGSRIIDIIDLMLPGAYGRRGGRREGQRPDWAASLRVPMLMWLLVLLWGGRLRKCSAMRHSGSEYDLARGCALQKSESFGPCAASGQSTTAGPRRVW